MFKKTVFVLSVIFCVNVYAPLKAASVTYLMDTPTPSILDYGSYDMQFRMFSEGGVLTKLNFGVFKSLNLGVSLELANIIGSGNVTVATPALQLKFNFYAGNENIPGFAAGYDGQGFFYDEEEGEFIQKGKGIYLVAGKEIIVPSLNLNAGLNVNDFKDARLIGFVGADYILIPETLMVMAEYDNIGKGVDSRLNAGLRLWITENFDLDFIMRNLLTNDELKFGCERIFKLSYQSRF